MIKSTNLIDLYMRYPYKKNPDDFIPGKSKTVPIPYISHADSTDHKYSVDFKTYKLIITTFLGFLFQYLLQGGRYIMPGKMGDLIIYKYKRSVKKNIRWNVYNTTGSHSNEKNIHTNRYSPTLKWKRGKHMNNMTNIEVNWWNFLPSRGGLTMMGKYLSEDPSRIYQYQTYNRR